MLIPAFALGRAQEMVYALHELYRAGLIPEVKIYVDSPLAVEATTVFRMHPEVFDRREQMLEQSDVILDFPLLSYIRAAEDSKRLNAQIGPAVIIAASGMVESGRILHHLAHGLGDPKNCILFVGFQAEHTLGRRILEGARQVTIFGDLYDVRAEVESIQGYSAHADRTELRTWVKMLGGPVRRAFVVHGEAAPRGGDGGASREEGRGRGGRAPAWGSVRPLGDSSASCCSLAAAAMLAFVLVWLVLALVSSQRTSAGRRDRGAGRGRSTTDDRRRCSRPGSIMPSRSIARVSRRCRGHRRHRPGRHGSARPPSAIATCSPTRFPIRRSSSRRRVEPPRTR